MFIVFPQVSATPDLNNEILAETPPVVEQVQTDPALTTVPESPQPVEVQEVKKEVAKPQPTITGSKETWLRDSGIPESEWWAVDYIVSKESSWNPNAVNRSSGACGLPQALPCSKLGTNWNDPVHALKWQYQYVLNRYGGYAQAYQFWIINKWY